jgi:YD repeat-containing protein
VTEASDQTSAFTTNYAYDIGDRLKTVTAGVQTRTFNYDKRGLLSSETHPELGVYGNGTIAYGQYDARGHAHNKKTGTNSLLDLHFTFDAAERLTEVDDSGSALRPLKKFVFATANDTSSSPVDARNGKLYQAIRYNHPPIGDVTVTETYKYTNALGRPSQRDTVVQTAAGTMLQSFTQAFNYDVFGATAGEDFPRCASGLTCGGTPPANSVPFTHNNGFLTAVAPYATSITYNPDASVHRVVHGTTAPVTDSYEPDPSGMSRPSLITFDGFQGCTPPSASVSGDSTITSGSLASIQVVLTGTGPWTLTWSDGSVDHPTSSPFTKNVTPSSTTTYQVTKVSDAHCSAAGTGSATITVNCNPPVATVSGGGSILPGGSVQVQVQFTGTAPWSVTWSDGLAQSGIYSNPLLRTVSPNVTTNYRITAFSDANCAGSGAGNALVTVALATPASFATSAAGYGTTVVFTWSAVSGATWYQIESTDHLGGQFTNVMGRVGAQTGATQTTSLYLPLANPKTYIYRVIAGTTANGTDTISAPSATDYATTGNPLFSDDPPVAGSTHIAGVDLGELRKAIDAVRAAAGLTAAWSSYAAGSGRIGAADVVSMQTNLNDAVFRLTGRYLQYSGEAPASSHPIRAYQWQQLRDGVK